MFESSSPADLYPFQLRRSSPCIDAGDNDAVPATEMTDLVHAPRFHDLADVPDTGRGDSPIVDMGAYEHDPDCNFNEVRDVEDIAAGNSEDCSANEIPDECEPDCNDTGSADTCDIVDGTSDDCGGNWIADECEPDYCPIRS